MFGVIGPKFGACYPNMLLMNIFPFKDLDVLIQMPVLSIKGDPFNAFEKFILLKLLKHPRRYLTRDNTSIVQSCIHLLQSVCATCSTS